MLADPKSLIDPGTERELVATCIANPILAAIALERTTPEHFGEPLYGKILRAISTILSAGKELSEFEVDAVLSGDPSYDSVGGLQFLVQLSTYAAVCKPENAIAGLGDAVRRNYLRREVRNRSLAVAARAEDKLNAVDEVISDLRETATELEDDAQKSQRAMLHIADITLELSPILQRLSEKPGEMLGFSTGYPKLDRQSSGFAPGSLTILAARPSMGKTAFALDECLRVAGKGNPVAIFSLETPRDMLSLRLACRLGRIDLSAITSGRADDEVWKDLTPAIVAVSQLPIYIDDRPRVKASDLRWRIRSAARRFSTKFVIVDYLQLATAKGDTRNDEIASVSGELQAAARELGQISGGALLVLSQLNRLGDRERPRLSHLRDSGAIEQDADAVWFLCESEGVRPGQFEPYTKELEIAKSRNGPTGTVCFDYIGQCMAFEEQGLMDLARLMEEWKLFWDTATDASEVERQLRKLRWLEEFAFHSAGAITLEQYQALQKQIEAGERKLAELGAVPNGQAARNQISEMGAIEEPAGVQKTSCPDAPQSFEKTSSESAGISVQKRAVFRTDAID